MIDMLILLTIPALSIVANEKHECALLAHFLNKLTG